MARMLQGAASRPNDEHLYKKLQRRAHEGEQSLDEKMMPFQRDGVRCVSKTLARCAELRWRGSGEGPPTHTPSSTPPD